ncbi:intracellular protein transport protein USO1-like [Dendronephthya gigantea]|uniref:intracellular protein transport protein USO1-like n=1 Tax=Dendronephthya gigantea TaxID=151771 RepID=UPI00106D6E1E|nr:intracellular protein transport protein USO1-like [Dendronephthya gigantea]
MAESSTRLYKMGKYTHVNCRHCMRPKLSNTHHVSPRRNLKDLNERRRNSEGQNEMMRRDYKQNTNDPASDFSGRCASDVYSSDAHSTESRINCANSSCEYRAGEQHRAAGKEIVYREKRDTKTRRQRNTEKQPNGRRFLTRSASCGNVGYVGYPGNETCTSSGTDSECSDAFESSSIDTCLECSNDKNSLERHRGIASMPNLMKGLRGNNQTRDELTQQAGNNHLGLEVMLSLINGPMQSVIDSKDEKIKSLERVVERLEYENKQIKHEQQPGDATKIFTLEKTLESCVRQIEQLEEAKKTALEKVRLLEDLRKNDKECIDILRTQTSDLESKLTKSDERVREVEKDGKTQNQWLKQQYEKQIEELQGALRSKEVKLRDLDRVKSRVAKQKQDLEDKRNGENELHAKMCEQVLELKRDLQLHQTRLNILEREKRSLEESLSQSENLQRQDQKSSYVLQMKIVELQEKLDMSYRKNEELDKLYEASEAKRQVLEGRLKQASTKSPGTAQTAQLQTGRNETKPESLERSTTVLNRPMNLDMNDVLREKVVELQKKLLKGQQAMHQGDGASEKRLLQNLNFSERDSRASLQEKWELKDDSYDDIIEETVPVRDMPVKKESTFTEDKRPSSDDSSSASSSASSSRRGSAESPRSTRRQLKVLKVRKVSKENISQFQQNAAYMMSLGRQPGLKDVRESPSGPHENLSAVGNRQTAFRPVKATR